MADYNVVLKDAEGYDICTEQVQCLSAAKKRAKYLLSDAHAQLIETTHDVLGTMKAEVQEVSMGTCVWDAFRM